MAHQMALATWGEAKAPCMEMREDEQPRWRLANVGEAALSDVELLANVAGVGTSLAGLDVARRVLIRFDGLHGLARASLVELEGIEGVGPGRAAAIMAALSLGRRAMGTWTNKPRLSGPMSTREYVVGYLSLDTKEQEEFWALLLDAKNRLTKACRVSIGLVDRTQVHPREVFKHAIMANCSRLILCHNHPSGDPTPSAQDLACTCKMVAAGNVIGIEVIDHVVIGNCTPERAAGYVSFKEQNLLH